jgi:putative peptidoglycan lipid II flippase
MQESLSKKNILKKLFQVGGNTLISRFLGLTREILLMRFLGVGVFADAFTAAFLIPNSLRKIFAEGALTAAFVPTFINLYEKDGRKKADALMSLSFIAFEGVVLLLCALVMWKPAFTLSLIVPGFSPEQIAATVPCLRILMPFIFFLSSSALLAGALQSVNHFFVPAFSPVLLNGFFIGGILFCLSYGLPVEYLCFFILCGGLAQFVLHIFAYLSLEFMFHMPNRETLHSFTHVLSKFMLCFLSMSVMEFNLIIDQRFASYLHVGSVTLIKYSSRFMGIPLGVFAVAFSTILLPHFSRISMSDPKRLSFYLLECSKFVFWVTAPATFIMGFLSSDIFLTLFASSSSKFPAHLVPEAGLILLGFLSGLFFFSLNKILFNLYYSFHDTQTPIYIAVIATAFNFAFNYILVSTLGGFGLALATSLSGLVQMVLCLYFLQRFHNFDLQIYKFGAFALRYIVQLVCVLVPFYFIYGFVRKAMEAIFTTKWGYFFMIQSFGYWLWVAPLMILCFYSLYKTRKPFAIELYFLD